MAAAYAALVSLMHIIEQIQHHPRPPIPDLNKIQVESLIQKVTFLQDFLEVSHNSEAAVGLETRIADAAYAAEDVIESHVTDEILARSTSRNKEKNRSIDLYRGLHKVIEDMDSIKKEVMEMKGKNMEVEEQLHRNSSISPTGSLGSSSMGHKSTMLGFDDVLYDIMDNLIGVRLDRQIIPIVGMGGIGKTTLAKKVYEDQVVVQHFDILAWVTISLQYSMRDILLELCLKTKSGKNLSQMSEDELGDNLHKSLTGRRYLVIMDDIWNIEVWDKIKFFFPENNDGSRIMLTTRLSKLAKMLTDSHGFKMKFLNNDESWNLLCKSVFGEADCPPELEKIGKKIAIKCQGLPLSIVVIGGLLAKSEQTREHWNYVEKNLNSIMSLEDDERCSKILYMSYKQLPIHLRPCFLYMGVFPEDSVIRVSYLIKQWIGEGFLKPIHGKSLEDVAEEYLKELIDRSLILVHELGSNKKIKSCIIHDLLRDLCLREAHTQKFMCVIRLLHHLNVPEGLHTIRRISIHQSTLDKESLSQAFDAPQSPSFARSLIFNFLKIVPSINFPLLRILMAANGKYPYSGSLGLVKDIPKLVNLRLLAIGGDQSQIFIPHSISLLWNLQTLIMHGNFEVTAPSEIWKLPRLRHVDCTTLYLRNPLGGHFERKDDNSFVLENLQTLMQVMNFKCTEEELQRIPNIKKLKIYYYELIEVSQYCLENLGRLHKLETLRLRVEGYILGSLAFKPSDLMQNISFPYSLKKLTLEGTHLNWEDLTKTKIGSLPHLEVLKLKHDSCLGPEWETVEGEFCSLKFLLIESCFDLECWNTDSTHFPRLEHLVLSSTIKLKEIPSSIGYIPTLESIQLVDCNDSIIDCAKRIKEEQEEFGNVGLQVQVRFVWFRR